MYYKVGEMEVKCLPPNYDIQNLSIYKAYKKLINYFDLDYALSCCNVLTKPVR